MPVFTLESKTHTGAHALVLSACPYTRAQPLRGSTFLWSQQTATCSVQDLSRWQSSKTGRGPLEKGWRDHHVPIMCSYKRVQCRFEVYGFQTKTEEFIHKVRKPVSPPPWSDEPFTSDSVCQTGKVRRQMSSFRKCFKCCDSAADVSACSSLRPRTGGNRQRRPSWLLF